MYCSWYHTVAKPNPTVNPCQPEKTLQKYQPVFGFMERTFTFLKIQKNEDAAALFQRDYDAWVDECIRLDEYYVSELAKWESLKVEWENSCKIIEEKNVSLHTDWVRSVKKTKAANEGKKTVGRKAAYYPEPKIALH